ncbi:MAG: serine/threonine protein kinase [Cytophagaceae bacterium]|nr:serine/threonine protein kinase [Gemmatimonadaceae bacterium]
MSEADRDFLALQRALIGRYSLVRELGRGGMGVVYLARDVALDRPVAIKLLPPALATDDARRAQFLREARLAASLAHPNIVPVHAVESSAGLAWFAMGYVDGESLGARVRRLGPLPPGEVVHVIRQVAMALAHAHARGVVHRDVKPDNILIERETYRALVTDFGIAHRGGDRDPSDAAQAGTPHYVSPEQAEGAPGDARSDEYALGVTAWFALTGRHPHESADVVRLLVAKTSQDAPPLATAVTNVPPRFAAAIDRALARRPEARWPDLEQLAREFDSLQGPPDPPPVVRAFVRTALTLGDDIALSAGVALSSLGVMKILMMGSSFFDGVIARAVLGPTAGIALTFGAIRAAQAALAAIDVVRQGRTHDDVAHAVSREVREREIEETPAARAARRKEALTFGVLGAVKTGAALGLALTDFAAWIWLPAAVIAAIVPALTGMKVYRLLRPGVGPWPRWLQGRFGKAMFAMIGRVTPRPAAHQLAGTPTMLALGGQVSELFSQLPGEARSAMADVPAIVEQLQREAEALRARERSEATDARLATIATALETVRVELLSLQAGLRTIPDVTMALDRARQVSLWIDEVLTPLPEITPA